MPLRRKMSLQDNVRIAQAMSAIADVAGVTMDDRPRVTLVIRMGGTGKDSDNLICTDDEPAEVAAALLLASERAGRSGDGLDS
jgi:hypothetical protein